MTPRRRSARAVAEERPVLVVQTNMSPKIGKGSRDIEDKKNQASTTISSTPDTLKKRGKSQVQPRRILNDENSKEILLPDIDTKKRARSSSSSSSSMSSPPLPSASDSLFENESSASNQFYFMFARCVCERNLKALNLTLEDITLLENSNLENPSHFEKIITTLAAPSSTKKHDSLCIILKDYFNDEVEKNYLNYSTENKNRLLYLLAQEAMKKLSGRKVESFSTSDKLTYYYLSNGIIYSREEQATHASKKSKKATPTVRKEAITRLISNSALELDNYISTLRVANKKTAKELMSFVDQVRKHERKDKEQAEEEAKEEEAARKKKEEKEAKKIAELKKRGEEQEKKRLQDLFKSKKRKASSVSEEVPVLSDEKNKPVAEIQLPKGIPQVGLAEKKSDLRTLPTSNGFSERLNRENRTLESLLEDHRRQQYSTYEERAISSASNSSTLAVQRSQPLIIHHLVWTWDDVPSFDLLKQQTTAVKSSASFEFASRIV